MAYKKFSTTKATSLSAGMAAGDTSVLLVDGSTYPDPAAGGNGPYTVIIGYGTDREEICTVTAKPSTNMLTVTRAEDGSAATSKNIGDTVVHGVSRRDWEDLLPKAGGTMTGAIVLPGNPSSDLQAAPKQYADMMAPIGTIVMYGAATAPTGWHLCDGTAHGSSALLAVIGSANTPDLRNRFIVAAGSTYAIGNTGGAATVTLTEAQSGLRGHNHTGSSAGEGQEHTHSGTTGAQNSNASHTHGNDAAGTHNHGRPQFSDYIRGSDLVYGSGTYRTLTQTVQRWVEDDGSHTHTVHWASTDHTHNFTSGGRSATHTHAITVDSVAGANATTAHENLPPYYALTFIIRK